MKQGSEVPLILEKNVRKFRNFIFAISELSPLGNGGKALYLKKLKSPSPKGLCAKFGRNWPSASGEKDFKFCYCIFTISESSPLGKRRGPSFSQT